jgi:uncharacterized protein
MLFIAACVDKSHSLDVRKKDRPAHLSYLNGLGGRAKIAGAPLGSDRLTSIGVKPWHRGAGQCLE